MAPDLLVRLPESGRLRRKVLHLLLQWEIVAAVPPFQTDVVACVCRGGHLLRASQPVCVYHRAFLWSLELRRRCRPVSSEFTIVSHGC